MLSSDGEVRIHSILAANGISFAEEYEFPDLVSSSGRHLRFDFCVFDKNGNIAFLIEYQGRQHYAPVGRWGGGAAFRRQLYNDKLKRLYCLDHGYNLVTIPYWDEELLTIDYILEAAGYSREVK